MLCGDVDNFVMFSYLLYVTLYERCTNKIKLNLLFVIWGFNLYLHHEGSNLSMNKFFDIIDYYLKDKM